MLSENQRKKLHGKKYVELFKNGQSKFRLERVINSMNLKTEYNVVDFGCGNGMLLPLIKNRVSCYTGVDFSEEFIEAAKNQNLLASTKNAKFICKDVITFCNENRNTFDVAFAMDFSEHVYDEEWLNILKSINYSLKDGGKLYIHTPNLDFLIEKMKKKNFILKQFPEHVAVRNIEDNCNLLKRAGFNVIKIDLIAHYNLLKIIHPISFVPFVGRFFKARIFIESTT